MLEHLRKRRGILLHVHVVERDLPPFIIVTGGLRVGSRVLAEDLNLCSCHILYFDTSMRGFGAGPTSVMLTTNAIPISTAALTYGVTVPYRS